MTKTKTVYAHDANGIYTGPVQAYATDIDPGTWLGLPAHYLDAAPPALAKHEAAKAASGKWTKVPDWRGVQLYSTADGSKIEIAETGKTPADVGATDTPPLSPAHTWQNGKWALDAAKQVALDAQERIALAAQIDAAADAVYDKFARRAEEYKLRETDAQAFKNAGYKGEAPRVAAFASTVGMPIKDATDLVLQQAAGLRGAVVAIGDLRMRKNEVLRGTDLVVDRAKAAQIVAAIGQFGEAL